MPLTTPEEFVEKYNTDSISLKELFEQCRREAIEACADECKKFADIHRYVYELNKEKGIETLEEDFANQIIRAKGEVLETATQKIRRPTF